MSDTTGTLGAMVSGVRVEVSGEAPEGTATAPACGLCGRSLEQVGTLYQHKSGLWVCMRFDCLKETVEHVTKQLVKRFVEDAVDKWDLQPKKSKPKPSWVSMYE